MSERAIAVGDLVMMVRGHVCMMVAVGGVPFIVTRLTFPFGGGWHCRRCHQDNAGANEAAADGFSPRVHVPVSWLVRIDPPAVPDTTQTQQEKELTA